MELYDQNLINQAEIFSSLLTAICGEPPRCRFLLIDYKDQDGADHNQDVVAWQPKSMTDEVMVEEIKKEVAKKGYTISAISDVRTFQALYLRPGFMEESMRQYGLPVPKNMAARLKAMGLNPVNMAELESEVIQP